MVEVDIFLVVAPKEECAEQRVHHQWEEKEKHVVNEIIQEKHNRVHLLGEKR